MPAIWAEVLAQRDKIQAIIAKELEDVTHEDCAALGAAARRVDELTARHPLDGADAARADRGQAARDRRR